MVLLAWLWAPVPNEPASRRAMPVYSAASVVNSASNRPGPLAPNGIITLYGVDLAFTTRGLQPGDISGGMLPTVLPNTGVRVLVNGLPAFPYYVSPRQVNLLLPSNLVAGPAELQLRVDGVTGPAVRIQLAEAAPALYLLEENLAVATTATGELLTRKNPARPGEWVILYGTGFGATNPHAVAGEQARGAAPLAKLDELLVFLEGARVDAGRVGYAGLAPGYAGLYQLNLQLPSGVAPEPEIRIVAGGASTPAGVKLPVSR